jgi:DeoR family fructose operon transcriptional repressor
MYAPERHRAIIEQIVASGRASVVELAESLDVTPETIRRDLSILERQGQIKRVHGGAIPVRRLGFQPTVDSRSVVRVAEKKRIAQAAIDEIPNEGSVIIDAGTSTGHLVELMPKDRSLTVVTNSVQHAMALAGFENITLMMVGGRVRGRTLACVDSWAADSLKGICADVAFIGTDGFSVERGLTTPNQAEAKTKAAILAAARRKVVLVDSLKYGDDHFSGFADLADIDVIITDSGLDDSAVAEIEAAGPMVVLA